MVNRIKFHWVYVLFLNLTIISGTLLILNLLPGVVAWMEVQHWGLFLGVAVLLAIIPMKKFLSK